MSVEKANITSIHINGEGANRGVWRESPHPDHSRPGVWHTHRHRPADTHPRGSTIGHPLGLSTASVDPARLAGIYGIIYVSPDAAFAYTSEDKHLIKR